MKISMGSLWQKLIFLPLGIACTPIFAQTVISETLITETDDRVMSVAQLSDVKPNDWSFQALQSLVEQYACIKGFPHRQYLGTKVLSRYEFAAGINSCLNNINELLQSGLADQVNKEDLSKLQRLQEEFAAEIATIKSKVDGIETTINKLESQQFSPIVKFNGEVIFGLAFAGGGGCSPEGNCLLVAGSANPPQTNPVFASLVRLGLQATFTGEDRLRAYLTTGNFSNSGFSNPNSLNTLMSRLSYQAGLDNQFILDLLEYRTPITDRFVVTVVPVGFSLTSVLAPNSPYFDTGRGAISSFGEVSPILKIGGVLDSGAGFDWLVTNNIRFQFAYGAGTNDDSAANFTGADRNVFGTNLLIKPAESILLGLHYVNAYSSDGTLGTFTGSINAETAGRFSRTNLPTTNASLNASGASGCCNNPIGNQPAQIDAIGGTLQWRLGDVVLGAWGGLAYTNFFNPLPSDIDQVARTEGVLPGQPGATNPPGVPAGARNPTNDANNRRPFGAVSTYLFSIGLDNPFGRSGDLFAVLFGQPPKLFASGPESLGEPVPFFEIARRGENIQQITDNNPNALRVGRADDTTSYHIEMFYRYRINQYLSITPGFFIVTNPGHISTNNTLVVGTIRTTFRF